MSAADGIGDMQGGGGGLLMRAAARAARARWFGFLRRAYVYQNGPRSDVLAASNPFNSPFWLAAELAAAVAQVGVIAAVLAAARNERPLWPVRLWVGAYALANLLSLPLIYWRRHHSAAPAPVDIEHQGSNEEAVFRGSSSYLVNKLRTFLELFTAVWFVMGNVWVFDARYTASASSSSSLHLGGAPMLHALCVALLAYNAVLYSFPLLLFLLLCCVVPFVSSAVGFNMSSAAASAARGASDEQLEQLPKWRFKAANPGGDPGPLENPECCICLAKYRERDEVRQLPCSHLFHLRCVDRWLRIISCCPLCKLQLEKQ
ncbi:E3 ubiquitin-protein ligase At4g11680-like [Ananas comosus]|uniref:E3 ubiquitin-protein ligase At4g11680-like n=3 Tax=Ananas comosus TaxID=4615 RepID=A0A6P5GHC4_ANACO|nr:E3 ubiquitin-protein ligase At4g11680-like [Ananas comosus]CAD1823669.1 unnamed protein product [Ananas comosus var. bracteatus]